MCLHYFPSIQISLCPCDLPLVDQGNNDIVSFIILSHYLIGIKQLDLTHFYGLYISVLHDRLDTDVKAREEKGYVIEKSNKLTLPIFKSTSIYR